MDSSTLEDFDVVFFVLFFHFSTHIVTFIVSPFLGTIFGTGNIKSINQNMQVVTEHIL